MSETIGELAKRTFANSQAKGFRATFWNGHEDTNLDQKLMLIVRELGEAHEELRDGRTPTEVYYREDGKPEGFGVEMADAVIRIMDVCEALGIDLETRVVEKMGYNSTRPVKHGRQF